MCCVRSLVEYIAYVKIKLGMEMRNMSKRQQPDQIAADIRRPRMDLQCSEKVPHPDVCLSWSLNNNMYQFSENGRLTKFPDI